MTEATRTETAATGEIEETRGLRGAPITSALLAANAGVFAAQVSLAGNLRFALGT